MRTASLHARQCSLEKFRINRRCKMLKKAKIAQGEFLLAAVYKSPNQGGACLATRDPTKKPETSGRIPKGKDLNLYYKNEAIIMLFFPVDVM